MDRSYVDLDTVVIKKGEKGADYLTTTDSILKYLKDTGCTFVIRYIARNSTSGKIITPEEVKKLHSNGIAVGLIFEQSAGDFLKGAKQGTLDGEFSAQFAQKLGYPNGAVISAAADKDVTKDNLIVSAAYMQAFKAAINKSGYKYFGMYADEDLGAAVACDCLCIPGAQYWSRKLFQRIKANLPWGLKVHMIQGSSNKTVHIDPLTTYQEFFLWYPSPPKPVVKVPAPTIKKKFPAQRGANVKDLQVVLKKYGWYPYQIDGVAGPKTIDGICLLQKKVGVTVDGVYGPLTADAYRVWEESKA